MLESDAMQWSSRALNKSYNSQRALKQISDPAVNRKSMALRRPGQDDMANLVLPMLEIQTEVVRSPCLPPSDKKKKGHISG
jgi:hypothetical protein